MLLYGAGGHARVLISILKALNQPPVAIFDDDPNKESIHGIPVVGPYNPYFRPDLPVLLAVGENDTRCQLATLIRHSFGLGVHPSAVVDSSAIVGQGTVVVHRAVVQANAQLGQHVIVNTGASVDHDCVLGDFVQVAPGAVLCGNVRVGEGTLIAAGAVVVPGIEIGRWAVVGAGAVVTRNVPDGAVVWNSPARLIRFRNQ
jgi:sugar O-acyltransferase (sialic acid O-acetyltransferase NeuD family)